MRDAAKVMNHAFRANESQMCASERTLAGLGHSAVLRLSDFWRYFFRLEEGGDAMDPNIIQLAHEARDLLAPVLPYLLPAAASAGKAALKRAGEKINDVTWNKAEAL